MDTRAISMVKPLLQCASIITKQAITHDCLKVVIKIPMDAVKWGMENLWFRWSYEITAMKMYFACGFMLSMSLCVCNCLCMCVSFSLNVQNISCAHLTVHILPQTIFMKWWCHELLAPYSFYLHSKFERSIHFTLRQTVYSLSLDEM